MTVVAFIFSTLAALQHLQPPYFMKQFLSEEVSEGVVCSGLAAELHTHTHTHTLCITAEYILCHIALPSTHSHAVYANFHNQITRIHVYTHIVCGFYCCCAVRL
jgi:hypothetical protein